MRTYPLFWFLISIASAGQGIGSDGVLVRDLDLDLLSIQVILQSLTGKLSVYLTRNDPLEPIELGGYTSVP